MNSTLMFLVLLATITLVYTWVCPVNYCDSVECKTLTAENCLGKIVNRGSTCGCCDSCVTVLEPGQNCIGLLLRGMPPTVACPDGYNCDAKTITCQPKSS